MVVAAQVISNEGFELVSTTLEELISEKSYNEPALYCATVEAVSEGREDEARFFPAERKARLQAMRPTLLFGNQAADTAHGLHEWMCAEMSLVLRKQVLISRTCGDTSPYERPVVRKTAHVNI